MRDTGRRLVRFIGIVHDITERKLAEEKLRKQEQTFRDLLEELPAAIYTTDAAGRITYYNKGAANLWRVHPRLGKDFWSDPARFYHADGTPMALADCPTEIA